ncbi:MAG: hypothetical protein HKN09_02610 [Saprospiraceae bacterium]|nr:hypothetical protein [Saprospiraceae bacterium]
MHIYTDLTGLIHLIASASALITGTVVLVKKKGTINHKRWGYLYTMSMATVVITSFMMYNLFGGFGIFHFFATISGLTLIGGMLPMFLKRPKHYISMHFSFMFWSVFGLYGAFMAEVLVRIPKTVISDGEILAVFYNMVGIAVFIVMGIGYFIFSKKKKTWSSFEKG